MLQSKALGVCIEKLHFGSKPNTWTQVVWFLGLFQLVSPVLWADKWVEVLLCME